MLCMGILRIVVFVFIFHSVCADTPSGWTQSAPMMERCWARLKMLYSIRDGWLLRCRKFCFYVALFGESVSAMDAAGYCIMYTSYRVWRYVYSILYQQHWLFTHKMWKMMRIRLTESKGLTESPCDVFNADLLGIRWISSIMPSKI